MRWFMVAGAAAVLTLVIGVAALDGGEVVLLQTVDGSGRTVETPLWFADLDGVLYVRAASQHAPWLERLRERPSATLSRGGRRLAVRAVPVDDERVRSDLRRAMEAKYGRLSRFVERLQGRADVVAVRLEPARVAAGPPRSDAVPDGVSGH